MNIESKKKELQKLLSEMDSEDVSEVLKNELDESTTAAISGNKKKRRPPPHAWKPGQSGNPSGRPKDQFSFAKQFRNSFNKKASEITTTNERALELGIDPETITIGELYALNLVAESMSGRDSVTREIINRMDGKIPDVVIAEVVDTGLSKLSVEKLKQLAKDAMNEMDDETETDE